jgi:hypothetical protein
MELEVGMYVRTKDGIIGKYIQPDLGRPYITNGISFNEGANYGKCSNNIIDLIEVGDYVNGELVEYIEVDSYKDYVINSGYWCKQKDIKSIVTKEQFESLEYKL